MSRTKKILITGFEPFDGGEINPSEILVEKFDSEIPGFEIHKLILPVVFKKSLAILKKEAFFLNPDFIICLGLNAKVSEINLEAIAHNLDDARTDDNEGNRPQEEVIFEDGPETLDSTLPLKEMEDAILEAQIPVAISRDCGRFVCNHVFYGIRRIIDMKKMRAKAGFVHLPPFEKLNVAQQSRALEVMLSALK
ncbi:pyroglutamyl-peptidase I [Halobacteriovorax vibrionivorans]|uniref:Pyrrolidone-carboxylate peptidase n=1 Tax=Halobacteriovorax vibrionivorans TaxID=2152716 RepID=A0ABY0IGT0_9BACT|nr:MULTISPECIES: pyroglutamyl-peptidase I [Halobacteriovorax]RZF21739.1 pyroglutamyl-peptidase I [Halobacteriovorax vibrionivorans]TGD45882.1 pyroglutamyl-peptidase I [Halobacteriovorax sp. Y22]